jgi:hypothetical protein
MIAGTDSLGRTSMTERFKDFISRRIFHPHQGMTLGNWWALLPRHRFAIDLRHSPRALHATQPAKFGRRTLRASACICAGPHCAL